jgi:TonB family protein
MSTKAKLALLMVVAISMVACPFVAASEETAGVFTVFRVLVGKPAIGEAEGASVLIVPGTVVMLGRSPEQDATDVLQLMSKLKDSYRLGEVSLAGSLAKTLARATGIEMPEFGGDLRIHAALLGFDEKQATYEVSVEKPGEPTSRAKVLIARGSRGIVGSRDGAAAPYVFLTIEPLESFHPRVAGTVAGKGEITAPKIVSKVAPSYPEQARKARVDGVVILGCTVGADGVVRDIKPIRSEPMGLTEAAADAVKQWRYEPARTAAGKPVEVFMTITISFMLDRSKPPEVKK